MKTHLLLLLLLLGLASCAHAATERVLFRVEFTNSVVADVVCTLAGKDAEGFSSSRELRASALPPTQRQQFGALQSALSAAANAGGWRLASGEMAQTGSTSDFRTVGNPRAGEPGEPDTAQEAIPGTERSVLTLWQTQTKDGKTRYQTTTSEAWPTQVRSAVLELWQWLKNSEP